MSDFQTAPPATRLIYIMSHAEADNIDDREASRFALFLCQRGFATGRSVPANVLELLQAAYADRPACVAFGQPLSAHAVNLAAYDARQAKRLDAARGLLALHDIKVGDAS